MDNNYDHVSTFDERLDMSANSEETGKSLTLNGSDISSSTGEYYNDKYSTTDDYYNKYKLPDTTTISTGESDIKIPNDYETRVNPNDPRYIQMYLNGKWCDINISTDNITLIGQKEIINDIQDGAKHDKGKLQITLMPTEIIRAITEVRMFGAKKYKPANWINVSKRRYKDALLRHILEYIDNEDAVDSESGLPALWHAACNIAFLIDMHRKDWEKRKEQITKNFADMEEESK